jgi:uncharacterized membrane protein YedE/YeeE
MNAIAAFVCGLIFGFGLLISGMMRTEKVLGFLDITGAWDPSLVVVMASALIVAGVGFALLRSRARPVFAERLHWPTATDIDKPLVGGAVLFGVGWGLVGLCPGPAIENLATLSPKVIAFVIAMAAGMIGHHLWAMRRPAAPAQPIAARADG